MEQNTEWFAIKTRQDFKAEEVLAESCEEIFFPKERIKMPGGKYREKATIPHVLFIRTTRDKALALEKDGRLSSVASIPFWIYRYPKSPDIQVIPQKSIDLMRLLTADDTAGCRIYTAENFTVDTRVKVTAGQYKGYEGFVKRIGKNRHVVVKIEGVCMVILPFIHPDLLQKL